MLRYSIPLGLTPISSLYYSSLPGRQKAVPVVKILPIRRSRLHLWLSVTECSILVLARALQTFHPLINERVGMKDPPVSRGTNPKDGIRGAVGVTVMITIGEIGTTGEMEVGEGGGEEDVVVMLEVGTIDRHTGIGIVMTEDRCPPDDTCGADGVDRGVLHRGVLDMGIFHGGPGVLLGWTRVDPRRPHSQLP